MCCRNALVYHALISCFFYTSGADRTCELVAIKLIHQKGQHQYLWNPYYYYDAGFFDLIFAIIGCSL